MKEKRQKRKRRDEFPGFGKLIPLKKVRGFFIYFDKEMNKNSFVILRYKDITNIELCVGLYYNQVGKGKRKRRNQTEEKVVGVDPGMPLRCSFGGHCGSPIYSRIRYE